MPVAHRSIIRSAVTSLINVDLSGFMVRNTNLGNRTNGLYVPGASPASVEPPLSVMDGNSGPVADLRLLVSIDHLAPCVAVSKSFSLVTVIVRPAAAFTFVAPGVATAPPNICMLVKYVCIFAWLALYGIKSDTYVEPNPSQ